jgi:hypothetical protein
MKVTSCAPHFFKKSETVTKERYLEVLKKMKLWIKEVTVGKPYIFQQDGAPAYYSHLVQICLDDNMGIFRSNDFWPPNSPDLNPLDYYICSVVRRDTNKSRHPNIASLQKAIQAIFMKLQGEELKRACQSFHPKLEAITHNGGGYGG